MWPYDSPVALSAGHCWETGPSVLIPSLLTICLPESLWRVGDYISHWNLVISERTSGNGFSYSPATMLSPGGSGCLHLSSVKWRTELPSEPFHIPTVPPPPSHPFLRTEDHLLCRQAQASLLTTDPLRQISSLPSSVASLKGIGAQEPAFSAFYFYFESLHNHFKMPLRPLWKNGLHKMKW